MNRKERRLRAKAARKETGSAAHHCALGVQLAHKGKIEEALSAFNRALKLDPDHVDAHYNLGVLFQGQGDFSKAISSFQRAVAIKPDFTEALNNIGLAFDKAGSFEEAVCHFHKALAINPDFFEAHNNLGLVLQSLGRMDEAIASCRKATAIKPNDAEAHTNLGGALKGMGRMDEAIASCRKALAIKPGYAEAYRLMAQMITFSEYDQDMRAMANAHANPAISNDQRMHLSFALGKAFEDIQKYEQAFDFFAEGNSIIRQRYNYSADDEANFFKKLEAAFDKPLFDRLQGSGRDDQTPIFIVGMMRSGTSLVEQILASHRHVHGAGELKNLGHIGVSLLGQVNSGKFSQSIAAPDQQAFAQAGIDYIKMIREICPDKRFITDKMPGNFIYLGLIKLMLPQAKVIHCARDAMDTCLSIFKNYFPDTHRFSNDLEELGRYYNLYRHLMEHWHAVMPGFIHDVCYEDLVADQAGQTRALLEFCGLEWDDACLQFYKTNRPVRTASAEQVRRPIFSNSVHLWKQYQTRLAPLAEVLG